MVVVSVGNLQCNGWVQTRGEIRDGPTDQYLVTVPSGLDGYSGKIPSNFPIPHPVIAVSLDHQNKMTGQLVYICNPQQNMKYFSIGWNGRQYIIRMNNSYLAVGNSRSTMSSTWRASWGASACRPCRNSSRWWRSAWETNLINTVNDLSLLHDISKNTNYCDARWIKHYRPSTLEPEKTFAHSILLLHHAV